ncbi:MAG TPA: glycosyltransferase family 4 protein [Vicinamibacterales bacterium]|nr:glycosyltransferase family 4 protein [Vicinamibacterales bacterium]
MLEPLPRIKVAVVAPSLGILGGQAVQADRLVGAWREDPAVAAWLVPVNPLPSGPLRAGVRVKYLRTIVTQLTYWPLLVRELRRADVVHVFSASYFSFLLAPLPAIIVARALGKPVVLNYRSGEAPDHLRRSRIARAALARVDRNIVPSTFLRDVFASFGLQASVISNVVDLERFRFRVRNPLRPRLLSTRNFEALYNVACTLRAFRAIQDRFPDATLTLVGDGGERAPLERLARELGLRQVTFAGRVPPDEIWRYYDAADIYVQTPDIDNMPASVLEAYASGLAVVSTDAGGVPYILQDGREGLLAPRGDAAAVATAVLRLLDSPDLAASTVANGRAFAESCTWRRVRPAWVSLYRELSGAAPVAAPVAEWFR